MVLLMAMLDESFTPGVFQQKLEQGLRENELPHIRYTPEPGTANRVMQLFANNNRIPTELLQYVASLSRRYYLSQRSETCTIELKTKPERIDARAEVH